MIAFLEEVYLSNLLFLEAFDEDHRARKGGEVDNFVLVLTTYNVLDVLAVKKPLKFKLRDVMPLHGKDEDKLPLTGLELLVLFLIDQIDVIHE
jgi:hypothetical protein